MTYKSVYFNIPVEVIKQNPQTSYWLTHHRCYDYPTSHTV